MFKISKSQHFCIFAAMKRLILFSLSLFLLLLAPCCLWAQGSTNRAYWAYIDKYKKIAVLPLSRWPRDCSRAAQGAAVWQRKRIIISASNVIPIGRDLILLLTMISRVNIFASIKPTENLSSTIRFSLSASVTNAFFVSTYAIIKVGREG